MMMMIIIIVVMEHTVNYKDALNRALMLTDLCFSSNQFYMYSNTCVEPFVVNTTTLFLLYPFLTINEHPDFPGGIPPFLFLVSLGQSSQQSVSQLFLQTIIISPLCPP